MRPPARGAQGEFAAATKAFFGEADSVCPEMVAQQTQELISSRRKQP
jgi:hypothetical protein